VRRMIIPVVIIRLPREACLLEKETKEKQKKQREHH
jgi:hypothetical protein